MAKKRPTTQHAEIVKRFAAQLRTTRVSRGMTQLELARLAHVPLSHIGRLEGGGAAPGIDMVDRLAVALGTSVTALLPATEPPQTADILRERARMLFERLVEGADQDTLVMLNPLLARLGASKAGGAS
jgi:transcriptional regulator with XRE-family HTH domain